MMEKRLVIPLQVAGGGLLKTVSKSATGKTAILQEPTVHMQSVYALHPATNSLTLCRLFHTTACATPGVSSVRRIAADISRQLTM